MSEITKYYSIAYPDVNIMGNDYVHHETLSENDILERYWDTWCNRMIEIGKNPEVMTFQNCIDDWCTVHYAQRNYWREMKNWIS
jgi:hypothetical protein